MAGSKLYSIMLPVRGDGKGDNVLAHAASLARKFGSHVKVVHCHPNATDMMPYGVVVPSFLRKQIEAAVRSSAGSTETHMRKEYEVLAEKHGLKDQATPEPGVATTSFIEYEGKQVDAVSHHGRLADLICVAQPDHKQNLGANTLKSALFSSGRPVMVCPHRDEAPETVGRHVAVGWNGSLEASRAVRFSMPFFDAAEKVTILVTGTTPHVATAEELQEYLAHRGVKADIRKFEAKGIVGGALLTQCDEIGADLLVMGAYHESYERETVFGGNSQVVVDEARIPVVMAH